MSKSLTSVRIPVMCCTVVAAVSCAPAATPADHSTGGATATPSASARPSLPPGVPVLSGSVSIAGQFVATDSFTTPAEVEVAGSQTPAPSGSTCADYARGYAQDADHGGGRGFDAPIVQTTGAPGVYLSISLPTGYQGPGTYSGKRFPVLSGIASIAVNSAEGPAYSLFHSHGGETTFTVAADGSGTAQLTGWVNDETRGGNQTGVITGTVTWTCR